MLPAGQERLLSLDLNRRTKTILLVDDEEQLRRIVSEFLTEHGYHVLPAANGQEALAIAERHPSYIHLLITDVFMPHLPGPKLAAMLSSSHPDLKVIFVSGRDPTSECDLPKGSRILVKPFPLAKLSQTVLEVLGG